jgi:hypothetical protein
LAPRAPLFRTNPDPAWAAQPVPPEQVPAQRSWQLTFHSGAVALALVAGGVGLPVGNTVTELSQSTGAFVKVISGAAYGFKKPMSIASNGARVFVANSKADSVTAFNAKTGALLRVTSGSTYKFDAPTALAAGSASVWVPNSTGQSVTEFPTG